MGKNRDQGTRWQTDIRERAKTRGWQSWTIQEGGQYDYGDVAIRLPSGFTVVLEAKDAEQLNIHATQDNAVRKVSVQSTEGRIPHSVDVVATAWARFLKRKPGKKRRVRAGNPIVAFHVDDAFDLLEQAHG